MVEFGCLGFRVDDILESQKGDQGGGPKLAKIQYGVKPDIFKMTPLLAQTDSCPLFFWIKQFCAQTFANHP